MLADIAKGIYGVISYLVSQQTREVGIRMAIGATPANILRLVLSQGFRLVAIGTLIGLTAALVTGRFISSLLFGISPQNPETLAAVAATLFAAAPDRFGDPGMACSAARSNLLPYEMNDRAGAPLPPE